MYRGVGSHTCRNQNWDPSFSCSVSFLTTFYFSNLIVFLLASLFKLTFFSPFLINLHKDPTYLHFWLKLILTHFLPFIQLLELLRLQHFLNSHFRSLF